MRKTFTLLTAILGFTQISQSQVGATAPDFTVTDIDGVTHNLYEYLDAGKVVIVDVSATWCGPCWGYHEAHFLEDIQTMYGPDGTDQVRVIFYEGDSQTTMADLQGNTGASQGDWISGTNYPIVNESPVTLNMNIWAPLGFPTVNVIRPEDKEIVEDLWNQWAQNPGNDAAALDAMEAVIMGAVGVKENSNATWSVYPNPTSGQIRISADQISGNQVQFDVTNALGQIVYSQQIKSNDLQNTSTIDLSNLASGNYVIRLIDEKSILTKNISIQ